MAVLQDCFQDPEEAFARGVFKRINPSTLDLPPVKPPPNPSHANLWLARMPPPVRDLLTKHVQQAFIVPLQQHVADARLSGSPLPLPKLHASPRQYSQLLDMAEHAGMLYWSIVPLEDSAVNSLSDSIQMTLFAMSKSETRSRLISWPRIPNLVIPDSPHTSLPDPSLFESVCTSVTRLSAFYLDIHNMFHNITLPVTLAHLFPMQPVPLSRLLPSTLRRLRMRLPLHRYSPYTLLRPFQATMPMGFKWSVFIAHTFADSSLREAFHIFKSSRLAPPSLSHPIKMQLEYAPFTVTPTTPFILHVIDDIAIILADWPDEAVQCWHRLIRRIFVHNHLPIAEKKSCPQDYIENHIIPFIGCFWDLQDSVIYPDPKKTAHLASQLQAIMSSRAIATKTGKRIVGRLLWATLLNRPLLSCTHAIFKADDPPSVHNRLFPITPAPKREILMLTTLLPLARAVTTLPTFPIVIAFDASLQAGAVTYLRVTLQQAHYIWTAAKKQQYADQPFPPSITTAIPNFSQLPLRKALIHEWRSLDDHINALEASAAILALEWAARAGARHIKLTILTDSLVVQGALRKGRSSSPALAIKCRRFGALALAHNIKVTVAYVPSVSNPADKYTRFPTSSISRRAEQ